MFYWLLKHIILGPILRVLFRPRVQGIENVPRKGPVIIAANHLSFVDSLFIPLAVPRRVVYLAKSDYFDKWYSRWFFAAAGMIPVRREGGEASIAALRAGVDALGRGYAVGIYPEGTRSPDGRLYRGKTGVARMALHARCPVVPVGVIGTREVLPPDKLRPRFRARLELRFGRPLDFSRYEGKEEDRFVLRSMTDEIMYELMMVTGQEYVDEYASRKKKPPRDADAEASAGGQAGDDLRAAG